MPDVEVVYISQEGRPFSFVQSYVFGMTVADLLMQSGVYALYPNTQTLPYGIFSHVVSSDTLLKPGDRVEIYRSLLSDPKEKRRQRARNK
jgi:putative ubiquitin-RnfH superfamily antitoxin RatB of RatAB toxin-antitoxin module